MELFIHMNVRAAEAKEEDDIGGDAGNALKFAAGKAGGNASDRLNDIKDVPTFKKVIMFLYNIAQREK